MAAVAMPTTPDRAAADDLGSDYVDPKKRFDRAMPRAHLRAGTE
jgi:hypothetical protein